MYVTMYSNFIFQTITEFQCEPAVTVTAVTVTAFSVTATTGLF